MLNIKIPGTKTHAVFFIACVLLFASCASAKYITIAAVGDNLIHEALIDAARTVRHFDFKSFYSEIKPVVKNADIAFINQETMIAGDKFGLSGYPRFNGPQEVGDAIVDAGFNVVNHASNHTLDKGVEAVETVIEYWQKHGDVTVLGINSSTESRQSLKIKTVKKIKFGFLAYTYGLNGLKLPAGKEYLISLIDKKIMKEEIEALRPACDFLIVSMHWGSEYEYIPNAEQIELAGFLASENVDLVIGHHPHVLQPVKVFRKADGGSMLCAFSLGNFISSQSENPRLLGAMLFIKLKTNKNKCTFDSVDVLPLITHYEKNKKTFKVYFLKDYSPTLALAHGLNDGKNIVNLSYFENLLFTIFGSVMVPRF